jgi:hypothetical protein
MNTTPELPRIEVRRLLDAAEMTTDHEARGKLLAEAFSLAQLAAVKEHQLAGRTEEVGGSRGDSMAADLIRGSADPLALARYLGKP